MKKLTTEIFTEKASTIHAGVYDYSNVKYIHAKEKVDITCKIHGSFLMTPNNHIYGKQGCPTCGDEATRLTVEDFIQRSHIKHKNKYDYSNVVYQGNKYKVQISCSIHGIFTQTPDQHLNTGTGCPRCTYDNYPGGYSHEYFEQNKDSKSLPCNIYLVQFENNSEQFLKIGITRQSITKRFTGYNNYIITPILTQKLTLYDAFCIEQEIIKILYRYKYNPDYHFKGWTECFVDNIIVREQVIDYFNIV